MSGILNRSRITAAVLIFLLICPFSQHLVAAVHAQPAEAGAAWRPRIYLEGESLPFDIGPRLHEEMLMLPLRVLAESAGFLVRWDKVRRMVSLHSPGREIALYPGNPLFAINGIVHRTIRPPLLHGGRVLVGPDLLAHATGLLLQDGAAQGDVMHFKRGQIPPADRQVREQPLHFVELLLPPGDRVKAQEKFEIRLAAPFVSGIFAYEILFFYNPDLIEVIDVHNPAYQPDREFYLKAINNREGQMRYTLTTLAYRENLPPREHLAVIEVVVSREGTVPLIEGTFKVTLLDNRAREMAVGLEERNLRVEPAAN